MPSSGRVEDELNSVLWMAAWVGKMELSSSLGTIHCVPQEKMFGQDDWILASFFLCEFMDLNSIWVHKHAKKELGQYPAILTSRLVNNPVITFFADQVNCQQAL